MDGPAGGWRLGLVGEHRGGAPDLTGADRVLLDAGTTTRPLGEELRWNAAYHRLAQGL